MHYIMLQFVAAIASVAVGCLFVAVFGITARKRSVASHRSILIFLRIAVRKLMASRRKNNFRLPH